MTIVVPNASEVEMLKAITQQNLILKLFSNNVTPAETDTVSTYTEVSGGGYSEKNLNNNTWAYNGGDPSSATYPQVTFEFNSAVGLIYGYYVIKSTGELMWSERFTTQPNIPSGGGAININLTFTLSTV